MTDELLRELRSLRAYLHTIPEPAFREVKTKAALMSWLKEHTGLEVEDRGCWFYAYSAGTGEGAPVALRTDFDAVAGQDGCPGHFCGHDGHASVLCGAARLLTEQPAEMPVYLIFQPAEETGQGAKECAPLLKEKGITRIFGWHNIPGYPEGTLLSLPGTFACASTGLCITLKGTPSHAAYPEAGKNPALLIADTIRYLYSLLAQPHKGMVLGTVIGVDIGSDAYGVSASEGTLRLTLRGEYREEFEGLVNAVSDYVRTGGEKQGFAVDIEEIERFPATISTPDCVEAVRKAAETAGIPVTVPREPFRWSEDFGTYLYQCDGAFFGIGDGENWPQLHTSGYEFNDNILPTAAALLHTLLLSM